MTVTSAGISQAKMGLLKLDDQAFLQMAFLTAVFILLLNAQLLHTGSHEASALDGLYAPMLGVIITFVLLYMSNISLSRFVANSALFTIALSVLMAVKYEFFKGGDVNFMYRLIVTVADASTYNTVFELPSGFVGVYPGFPGFVFLNVMFLKVTGLNALEGYKFLFPVIFGLLYPTSFFLLSGIATSSDIVKKAIVMAAVIPYALLPGAPWNYFMMPNYFAFLLFLLALHLILRKSPSSPRSKRPFIFLLLTIIAAMVITHPLASLYTAVVFTSFLFAKASLARTKLSEPSSLLKTPIIVIAWTATVGWAIYSNRVEPYFQSFVAVAVASFLEGFRIPSVTERLGTAGLAVFLITHLSKLMLGGLASVGLVGLAKRKIPGTEVSRWITTVSALLFLIGVTFFAIGYTVYDIFVGYRSLFLSMTILTIGSGLGLATLVVLTINLPRVRVRKLLRVTLTVALVVILAASLFELYPTEYVNPTVTNSVHTIYQKDTIEFLNRNWFFSSQIILDTQAYQVAQSYGSVTVFEHVIRLDELKFYRIGDPFTTVINADVTASARSNVIYNSGFTIVNSTLR